MTRLTILIAALAGVFVSAPALAKPGPCAKDIKKLCKGVKPGEGRILECLKANKAKLSPGCKAAGNVVKKAAAGFWVTCSADVKAHCPDVKPGGGRVLGCLGKHKAKLKPRCKAALVKGKEQLEKFNADCGTDIKAHCKGVKPGWGRVVGCLTENKGKLKAACRHHVEPPKKKESAKH